MATNLSAPRSKDEVEAKPATVQGCLYVKVSMDGAPYLRKVDLKMYKNYKDLSLELEKKFSCFTVGELLFHSLSFFCSVVAWDATIIVCSINISFFAFILGQLYSKDVVSLSLACILILNIAL
jgi:hypothetical protein